MKQLWQPIQILQIKEQGNQTLLAVATALTKEEITRYIQGGKIKGELKLDDGRLITADQRRRVFACVKDISLYTGYDAEYIRDLLRMAFCYEKGIDDFSLSDCSLETAREFITYLLDFCIDNEIPLSQTAIERTDDIGKYLYLCIKKSICCCCGKQGVVYSLSDGNKISLCNLHYDEAKLKGIKEFERLYKVYGIKTNE